MKRIDLRIGEASAIGALTFKLHSLSNRSIISSPKDWEYTAVGHKDLVQFLEDKHNAHIVITNGANQALHASLAVLQQYGYKNLGLRVPYWNRIPELLKHLSYNYVTYDGLLKAPDKLSSLIDSYLTVLPNNPDGFIPTSDNIKLFQLILNEANIPLIHDAAYYTKTYLPADHPIESIGDMQIFSASKAYGLSALRIGYIVVHNKKFYKDLINFIELTTVGTSILSQKLFLSILKREEEVPYIKGQFEKESALEIKKARKAFKNINPLIVEIPDNFEYLNGMFAWVKILNDKPFKQAKVDILEGKIFGDSNYGRINLGVGHQVITEAVARINSI